MILMAFIESAAMFGAFTYVGADLHLRFGISFTLVGLFVGAFAIGGLIYSLSVRALREPVWPGGAGRRLAARCWRPPFRCWPWRRPFTLAPVAIMAIGLGFYMLHNTLQTNATQMTPEARGTALGLFSAALYFGQTIGVAVNGLIFDRFTAVPVFLGAAAILLALGLWFARELKARAA